MRGVIEARRSGSRCGALSLDARATATAKLANARHVVGTGFTPVPFSRTAWKHFDILEVTEPAFDFYVHSAP